MSENYEKQVYLAMLAEQCSRYEDMINFLEEMIKLKVEDLSPDERNLLSIAYKNSISLRRTAIRTLLAYENKEAKKSDSPYIDFIKEYKVKVFKELESVCNKIITTIDSYLLQKAADAEAKVFYNKMKGDYYRYVAENAEDELKKKYSELGLSAYNVAMEAGKERDDLTLMVANHMKRDLSNWSTDSMSDERVADDIALYTDGIIQLDLDNQPLISDGELLSTRVSTTIKKKKNKK